MLLLAEPPSLDGEQTDKGSVNQRSVLVRRSADVERLFAARRGDPAVLFASSESHSAAKVAALATEGPR
jgi:hypothetical protein